MACRLPGDVKTPQEFWELCARKRSGWSPIPESRFSTASYYHPNAARTGTFNPTGGNFLSQDLARFDAPFFNISKQEALSLGPQQRVLLECTYEALEYGGIAKEAILGKDVGVFIGGSFADYELDGLRDTENIPIYQTTGNAQAMLSNRISYYFDLKGPSFTVDTACSSSMVALHLACQSIRSGESRSAIVGSAHLNLLPDYWISMSLNRLFSDAGKCFPFDLQGQSGYGRGESAGVLVLKPLREALANGDNVRALIMNTGISSDGATNGISMPSAAAQERLIRQVYASASIHPRDTGFVEAHGTGTKVGDPVEAAALHAVFGEGRTKKQPLYVGSVKSNFGHLEGASGVISVIKTAMMLERGFILPNCDFQKGKENIPLEQRGMKVPIKQVPWPTGKKFASVNNFGYGGTNAHVILAKAPPSNTTLLTQSYDLEKGIQYQSSPRKVYVLSANDEPTAHTMMKSLEVYIEQNPEVFDLALMDNLTYTLGQRRANLPWRVAISAQASSELISKLSAVDTKPARAFEPPVIGFVFTGQGAQWHAMGQELISQYPLFAEAFKRADQHIAGLGASFSLIEELMKDEKSSLVSEAHISQPLCSAVQIALTHLLKSWGVRPTAVVGHSSGEIGAAYAADRLTLEDCMSVAFWRGLLSRELEQAHDSWPKGSMMAIGTTEEDIEPYLRQLKKGDVVVACFNSDTSLTISGDEAAIYELEEGLKSKASSVGY